MGASWAVGGRGARGGAGQLAYGAEEVHGGRGLESICHARTRGLTLWLFQSDGATFRGAAIEHNQRPLPVVVITEATRLSTGCALSRSSLRHPLSPAVVWQRSLREGDDVPEVESRELVAAPIVSTGYLFLIQNQLDKLLRQELGV